MVGMLPGMGSGLSMTARAEITAEYLTEAPKLPTGSWINPPVQTEAAT